MRVTPTGFSQKLPIPFRSLIAAAAMLTAAATTSAATYQWDVNGATAGLGGTGTWNATNTFWDTVGTGLDTGVDTTALLALSQATHILQFRGTAGTVALSGNSSVGGLIFNTDGYVIDTKPSTTNYALTIGASGITANSSASLLSTNSSGGSVALGAAQSWTVATGKTLTVNAIVSGANNLTFNGAGTVLLGGVNTMTGTVTVSSGTIQIGNNAGLGGATAKLALNGGTIQTNTTATARTITAAGASTIGGDITFGAASGAGMGGLTFTAAFNLGGATRTLTTANTLSGVSLGRDQINLNGALSNGSIIKAGQGELSLGGTNTFSASNTLTVNAGDLFMSGPAAFGSLTSVTMGTTGRLFYAGSTAVTNFVNNNASTQLAIGGASGLGTVILDNANANISISDWSTSALSGFSGGLAVRQGVVTLSGSGINLTNLAAGTNRSAQTTAIGAANIYIGAGATSINTQLVQVGMSTTTTSTLAFATGMTGQSLTLRGTGGGSNRVSTITVGSRNTSYIATSLNGIADFTAGTLDAMVSTLDIGVGASGSNPYPVSGTFKMGAGTLDVTNLNITKNTYAGPDVPTGTFTLSNGGIVLASTVTLVGVTNGTGTTTYTGTLNLNDGTLKAKSIVAGSSANLTGTYVRTLNLNGGTLANYDASFDLTVGAGLSVILGSTSTIQADASRTVTINSVISGLGGLTKTGNGALILGAANTYSGVSRVTAGSLTVGSAGSLASGAIVDVAGGTFGFAGTQEWASGNLLQIGGAGTVGAGSVSNTFKLNGGVIGFDVASDISFDVLTLASGGTLDLTAGAFAFNLTSGGISLGTYDIVNYSAGTLVGSLANITKTGLAAGNSRQAFTFSDTGSALRLVVTGAAASVTWSGSVDSSWSSGPSSSANWTTSDTVDDTTHFYDGDSVNLAGAGAGSITLSSDISAGAVTVSGTSDYTLSGSALSASSLNKSGSGKLTLANALSTSGGLNISGGTVDVVSGGSTTGAITVGSNSTLLLSGGVVASATLSGGIIAYDGTGALTGLTALTVGSAGGTLRFGAVAGAVTDSASRLLANTLAVQVTDAGTAVTLSGTLSGSSATLNKTGAGALILTGTNSYTGTTTLTGGVLSAGNNAAFGSSTLALNGGNLSSDSSSARTLANAVTVGGDVTLGNATNNGALTLSGTVNLGAAERTLTVASDITASGVISNGSLTKAGAGVLTLTGTSTYTGATTVNAGVLQVGTGGTTGSLATDSAITVGASGTYRLYRGGNTSAVNIANTLAGSGTIELRGTGVTDQSYYVFTGANDSFTGNWSIQSGTRGNFGAQSNLGSSAATVNVASGGEIWLLSTTSAYTSNLTIAGTGWLEATGTLGAIRFQGVTLAGNVTLSADALIAAHGTLVNALSGNIGEAGGARTLEIKNTSTGGTSTFNLSGATTLSGGLLVGTPGTGLTVVNLTSTGTMNFAAGSTVALGNNAGVGTQNQTLNIAGAATNAGTLAVRRVGVLNINSGGTWAQSGNFTISASGGYSALAFVNAGGSLTYTGASTIKLEGAAGNAGNATLTVDSTGLLTTSAGFERTTVQGAGAGVGSIALTNGGTLKLGASIDQLLVGEAIMTVLGGANIHTNGYNTTVSKVISGSGGLTKTGNGTLTLNAANTYTGTTTVSGGTLALGGSGSIASTTVNLTNGGALADVTWGAGKTLQIGGAGTLGNGGVGGNFSLSGGTIGFDVTNASGYDSLTVATGSTFTLTSGVLAFNLTSGVLLAGTYDFINYSGATVVGDWINFNKTGLPSLSGSRQTVTFSDTGSALRLSVAGSVASVSWSAAVSNIWGIGASKDANWNTNDVVDDATHYYEGDNVTFGDTGAGTVTVDTGGVAAGAITVNAATNYTFAGASISAANLTKSGNGTLTLSNALSTATGTTVTGGTLAFVAGGALSGSLTVNGGAVNLGAQSVTLGAVVLADGSITTGTMTPASLDLRKGTISSIIAGAGNVVKSTSDTVVLSGANTYTGTTTINAGTLEFSSASAQTLTGNLLGSGGVLKKSGAGTLTLTPTADSTFAGDVNVTGGSLVVGVNYKVTGTGALTVGTGATFNSYGLSSGTTTIGNSSISFTGATWNLGGSSSGTVTHTYAFSGLSTPITVTDSALNFSSTNSTTKAFGAALNFSGSNTVSYASTNYTHFLNLNGAISGTGTLTFNTSGTSTGGKTITLASGLTNNFTGAVVLNSSNSSGVMSTLKLSSALGASSYEIKNAYWTLQNNVAGGLNSASSITVSAGTLDLTQAWSNSAATLTMTGGTVTVGNAASSIGSLSATAGTIQGTGASSSLTVNQTTSGIFAGILGTNASNNLTFTKTGAATLTLSGASTTTGLLTVSNGTLNLTGSLASGVSIGAAGNLSVSGSVAGAAQLSAGGRLNGTGSIGGLLTAASGATIDPGLSGSGTLTVGNLTFTNLGTVNLSQGTSTSMLAVTGTLTASGLADSITLNIGGGAPELGSYTLIDYSVLAGTGFSAFRLGNLPNRVVASLVNNTVNTSIDLNVTGVDLPVWRGTISSEWSTNTLATGSGANWVLNSDGVTETDFLVGDTVRFDDTASGTAVEITQANVTPAAAIFDNISQDYTLSGSYGVAGTGSLTKRGSGKLTISNSNSYTGATTVEAGILSVATVSDSGVAGTLGSGSTVVINGGTLEFTGTTGSSNRTVSLGSSNGTVSVSAANGVLTLSSAAVGAGGLTKTGNGTLVLSGANTYNGGTTVSAGTLQVGVGGATGSLTGAASIDSGAKLSLYLSNPLGITVSNVVSGSGTVELRGTGVQNESPYTISGNNVSFTGTWSVLSGARLLAGSQTVLGSGSVNIASGGGMYLSTTATYTSNVTIAGSGWNETAGYLGAIRFSGSTLSGGVTLAGNAVIGAHGASTNTLSGAIGETGGARTLEIKNTSTSGTAVFNLNGATTLSGGLQVGIASTGATTVSLGSAGSINLSGGQFRIGNNIGSGAATQTMNVAGAVTNAGSLYVGRPGVLNINNGGTWAQSGAGSVNSQGGYNTTMNVNTGGSFTYTNASTFKLNVGSSGSAVLNIAGGTFTTSAGFEQSAAASPGTASVNLSTAGTLKLGADIAEMSSSSNGGVLFTVGTGGGKIDTDGYNGTLSAGITGASGGLTKLGNGTLTLTGTSTYAGATVVSGGTLILAGGENTLADGSVTVSSGATLNLASTNAINHASFTSGSILISGGTLTQSAGASGANLADLYLANGGTLTTESSAGVSTGGWNYQLNSSVYVIGTSATSINVRDGVALNGSQVFNITDATSSAAADLTVTGAIVDGASVGSLLKTGAGTLALNSANSFTGQLQVNAGTVSVSSAASLGGSGTAAADRIVLNGGTLQTTASFATNANHGITINSAGGTIAVAADTQLTVSAALSGSGAFTKSDTGTLVLAAAGTFSGSTSVSAGTLQLGNVAALGSSIVTLNTGATLNLANFAATNTVFINGGSITNYGQWNGAVGLDSGAFDAQSVNSLAGTSVYVTGSASVDLSGVTKGVVLAGGSLSNLSTYNGNLAVQSALDLSGSDPLGSVELRQGGSLNFGDRASDKAITYKGGSLTGASQYSGSVTMVGTGLNATAGAFGTGALLVGTGSSVVIGNGLTNAINLNGGSLNAAGLSGYQGTLTIGAGSTVNLGKASTFTSVNAANTAIVVANGGVLAGEGTVSSLTVGAGGTLAPGNSPGLITVSGTTALNAGGSMSLQILSTEGLLGLAEPGVDYDSITTDVLDLTNLNSLNRFTISLMSLSAANTQGSISNFSPLFDYTFDIFTYGTLSLSAGQSVSRLFTIDTTNFVDDVGQRVVAGHFFVQDTGTSIQLFYNSAVPEPSTYGIALGGLALALAAVRRRLKQAKV